MFYNGHLDTRLVTKKIWSSGQFALTLGSVLVISVFESFSFSV